MIEMTQVRQFVAKRVHQAGILETLAGFRVAKAERDFPLDGADSVPSLHSRLLGGDFAVSEMKTGRQDCRIPLQASHQFQFFPNRRGGGPSLQTPHVPPYPMVTRPASTITGTRRCPPLCSSIFAKLSGSSFTSKYSTETPFSSKASRAAVV
jgi:hypothetical protein